MNDDCITDNGIGEEGAKVMSKMMKTNTTLTSLNLCSEEEKKKQGGEGRENNVNLFPDNEVKEEGVKAISEMLKVNTTLTSLSLSCEE